jgi:hypothetical protein
MSTGSGGDCEIPILPDDLDVRATEPWPASSALCRGVALGAGGRRHEDDEVTPNDGASGLCVMALVALRAQQDAERLAAGEQ